MARSKLQQVYEKHPYPAADETALTKKRWLLPPWPWINALWKPDAKNFAPARILVAGCGTGSESFAFREAFPKSEIVAVDFSARSIAIARKLQRRERAMHDIQFSIVDLTRNIGRDLGEKFDFISCHGVLTYLPNPEKALANLARQLKPDGALYLGVNGAEHFSVRGRQFLPEFGLDIHHGTDSTKLRQVFGLWDSILDQPDEAKVSGLGMDYLAGDLFGSHLENLPLANWVALALGVGLHFQAAHSSWRAVRRTKDHLPLIFPRSRAEVCSLVEILDPALFHRLLFTRRPVANPPWEKDKALRDCRLYWTNLYQRRLPKRRGAWSANGKLLLKSPALNSRLDWEIPEWELEILRRSDDRQTVASILEKIPAVIPPETLRRHLYILHQLLVITVLPP